MRIDFVFPKFKLLSGAERLILSLARALSEKGHLVRILCHSFEPSCRPLAEGLPVMETGFRLQWTGSHYLDSVLSYLSAGRLRRLISPQTQVVCLFGPALVLAWRRAPAHPRFLYFCYEPPRAAGIDRADVLERVGGWRYLLGPGLNAYRIVDRWLVNRVDGILVNGEFGRERVLEAYGLRSWPITHGAGLGGESMSRIEARDGLGLDPESPVALTVNFLHPRKRVDLLLRAWAGVERELAGALLLVVGDGPEAGRLHDLAMRLGLRGVRFCGFIPEESLPRYYRAADLLAHAAREETFGLTILEAAAHGVPAVTADEGGPRYTVRDGETGIRVIAEEGALAAALVSSLRDLAATRRMGARAQTWVMERFRWERGAEDFLAACSATGVDGP